MLPGKREGRWRLASIPGAVIVRFCALRGYRGGKVNCGAFASDYLNRVEGHFQRLHERYGIDFGRYLPPVQRMQLDDHVYDRLTASAGHHRTPEGDIHA
jgi:hypothetical protein